MKENKLLDIKKLLSRGASIALATTLVAGGLTSCDEQTSNIAEEPTTPIVDTITKAPTEEFTTNFTTEEPTSEPTTEPSIELETLSPELAEKYPPISSEDYTEFISKLTEKNQSFKDGISIIEVSCQANGIINIFYYPSNWAGNFYQLNTTDASIISKFSELLGNNFQLCDERNGSKLYCIEIKNISPSHSNSLHKFLYEITFSKEAVLE